MPRPALPCFPVVFGCSWWAGQTHFLPWQPSLHMLTSLTLPRSNVPTIPFCISYTPLEPCSFPSSEGNLLLLWEIPTCLCHQFLGASPGPSFWTHTQHLEGTYVPLCLGSMLWPLLFHIFLRMGIKFIEVKSISRVSGQSECDSFFEQATSDSSSTF